MINLGCFLQIYLCQYLMMESLHYPSWEFHQFSYNGSSYRRVPSHELYKPRIDTILETFIVFILKGDTHFLVLYPFQWMNHLLLDCICHSLFLSVQFLITLIHWHSVPSFQFEIQCPLPFGTYHKVCLLRWWFHTFYFWCVALLSHQ